MKNQHPLLSDDELRKMGQFVAALNKMPRIHTKLADMMPSESVLQAFSDAIKIDTKPLRNATSFVAQAEATAETQARFDLFNALVNGTGETAEVLAMCGQGIRTALEQGDPETQSMLQEIFVDEKLSADWCAANDPTQSAASPSASSAPAS